jgi:peptidoglycan lytic transglycosylase G
MIWSRFFNIALLFACGLLLLGAVLFGVFQHTLRLSVPINKIEYLYVEPGDGLLRVGRKAKQLGLVRRQWHFVAAARLLGQETRLQAGEYAVSPGDSLKNLIKKISEGDVHYRKLVVPEGFSVAQVEAAMAAAGLKWSGYQTPLEGSLLPETYFFTKGEQAGALIRRMQVNMACKIKQLWEKRAPNLPIKNITEALILASIVEKETGQPEERPLVAAVFMNRLKRKMRLQSDPTVVYGITRGLPLGRAISAVDLRQVTAYNTYRVGGLPPTPIANPGLASIAAVLAPADEDYLYFVADGSGGHAFATTLKEHNRNVARWRRSRATVE